MKNFILLLLILFVGQPFYSQNKNLTILDSVSKDPIPFASIEYIDKNSGVFADVKGGVVISDSVVNVRVSCLGYWDKIEKIAIGSTTIFLDSKIEQLSEIKINEKVVNKILLNKKKSKQQVKFITNTNGFYFARKFDDVGDAQLLKISADVKNDDVEKNILLNIFSVDEKGKPLENILTTQIYQVFKPNQKGFVLELEDDNIYLENDCYYFALIVLPKKDENNPQIDFGMTVDDTELSFLKPYFKKSVDWLPIAKIKNSFSNFNISIELNRFK